MFVVTGTEWLTNAGLSISSAAQEHGLSDVPDLTFFNFPIMKYQCQKGTRSPLAPTHTSHSLTSWSLSEDFSWWWTHNFLRKALSLLNNFFCCNPSFSWMQNLHQLVLLNNIASYWYYHFWFFKYFHMFMFLVFTKTLGLDLMALIIQGPQPKGKKPEILAWVTTALYKKSGLTSCPLHSSREGFPILCFVLWKKI